MSNPSLNGEEGNVRTLVPYFHTYSEKLYVSGYLYKKMSFNLMVNHLYTTVQIKNGLNGG